MSNYMAFLDTETSGFLKNCPADDPTQNTACEIAVAMVNLETRNIEQIVSMIIKTDAPISSFLVNEIHGISNELSHAIGADADVALSAVMRIVEACDWNVTCHNVPFDKKVMAVMLERSSMPYMVHDWNNATFYCTMERTTPACDLPPTPAMVKAGRLGPKAPKLEEAYQFFFNAPMGKAHRAWVDVQRTIDVYFALQDFNAGKHVFPPTVYSFDAPVADEVAGD